MVGSLKVGVLIRQTHIRFRNITDYEAYITFIDESYDAEDNIFNGYIYKINTPQFSLVKEVNMQMVLIPNIKLLNIEVKFALYQLKDIVSSNVLIS